MASSITLVAREAGRVGWDRVRPGPGALPAAGDALTPSFIERAASWPAGAIRSVEVLDEHHGTAGRVRAALERSSRAPAEIPGTVFVKLTPRSLVQRLMMNLYDLASREVLFYSSIAADAPVRTPECHSAMIDPRRGRNVMLLEDLDGRAEFRDIRDPVTIEEAGRVLDALADLHAAFWESPRFEADMAPLRSRRPAAERIGNMFVDRVLAKPKGSPAEVIPPDVAAHARRVVARRPEIDALWRRQPQTLCHGDTHLGNLFFEGDTPGFLDWQATMMAPSLRDVSYFLVSSVDPADLAGAERDLVDRYVERLAGHGIDIERDRAWETYRAIAVEIYVAAVVTAGTSDRMQPPEISRVGVDRVNEAVQRLDTFGVLEKMLDEAPGAGRSDEPARTGGTMELGLSTIGLSRRPEDLTDLGRRVEDAGYGSLWTAEAWGADAFTPLAFLAATTSTIRLGTAIAQIWARTPGATAMTALTLQQLSGGRLVLGLGVSGPQVVEGWHGVAFRRPVATTRDYVAILRQALAADSRVVHEGTELSVPYRGGDATGQGKPLRSTQPPAPDTPILLAALGPRNTEMAVEVGDGLLPYLWSPTHWRSAWGEQLAGAPEGFAVAPTVVAALGDDIAACRDQVRPRIAMHVGAMGSRETNFYKSLVERYGYGGEAQVIQDRWLGGDRAGSVAAVSDEMVDDLTLVGPAGHVAEQLGAWLDGPVTTLIVEPTAAESIEEIARIWHSL